MLVNIYIYIYWLIYTLSVSWQLRTMQLFLIYCYYFIKNAYMTFKVEFCWIWSALRMSCPSKISGLLYILLFFFCHATEISLELSTHTSCYATVSSPEVLNLPVMLRYCKFSWTFHSCLMPRYWKFSWTFHAHVMLCYCKFSWTFHSCVMLRYCKFSWAFHAYATLLWVLLNFPLMRHARLL